ncbi:MAG: PEP-CTERM sorting domain-containing protein [Planctomycetota bacterium]|jgi:hypothetical protein
MKSQRWMLSGLILLGLEFAVFPITPVEANIQPIGPFAGELFDSFNQYNNNMAVQTLSVFNDDNMLNNLSDGGAIKVEFSSSLNGDLVVPRSGMMVGQLGIGQWLFNKEMHRFGGYFENNSGQDDATLYFYNADDVLIGTTIADVPVNGSNWTWNGWQSDEAFTRIDVVGNGIIEGFIWYEDMQASVVPEPTVLGLMTVGGLTLLARRGRSRAGSV